MEGRKGGKPDSKQRNGEKSENKYRNGRWTEVRKERGDGEKEGRKIREKNTERQEEK